MDKVVILAQEEGVGFAGTITDTVSGMGAELATVGGVGLGIGIVVFGLQRGWKFIRSLV